MDLEVGGRVEDYPNDSIAENGRNPETIVLEIRGDMLSFKLQWKTIS